MDISSIYAVIYLFSCLFILMACGVPIAVSLGLSSFSYILIFTDGNLGATVGKIYGTMSHQTLMAIPFFILASAFLATGGVARRLIDFATAAVGHLRGGLAMASVLACMFFAAVCGSSPATVVAIGSIAIAGMIKAGYSRSFAAGVISSSGTLGILIPPSIVMVIYAAATNQSVGKLFMAGVGPGLLAGLMLMGTIFWRTRNSKSLRLPRTTFHHFMKTLREAGWGLFLIAVIMGGIYGGAFTPTEAAAVAAVYAFIIAIFVYCDMGPLKGRPPSKIVRQTYLGLLAWTGLGFIIYKQTGWALDVKLEAWFLPTLALIFCAYLIGVLWFWYRFVGLMISIVPIIILWTAGAFSGAVMSVSFPITALFILTYIIGALILCYGRIGPFKEGSIYLGQWLVYLPRALIDKEVKKTVLDGAKTTIMLMFIIANAMVFAHILINAQIPTTLATFVQDMHLRPWVFLIFVNVILLIAGNFMEPSAIITVMGPIFATVAQALGIDLIHLGIIMVVNMEIGMLTPPVGLNLFATAGVTGMSLIEVIKACFPWLIVLLIFLIIVTYIPSISLFLPSLLGL